MDHLRRNSVRKLRSTAQKLPKDHLKRLPVIRNLYHWTLKQLTPDVPQQPVWMPYLGFDLYIDPTDHIGSRLYREGEYEPALRDTILDRVSPGDTCFDVGGHIGVHMLAIRKAVGGSGQITVFEPNPQNRGQIRETVQRNNFQNIEIEPVGVSDTESTTDLHESEGNTGMSTTRPDEAEQYASTYEIDVVRLSDYIQSAETDEVAFIKMDIEGEEAAAIRDLEGVLSKVGTMIIEVHGDVLTEVELEGLFDRLNESGSLTDIERSERISDATDLFDKNTILLWE